MSMIASIDKESSSEMKEQAATAVYGVLESGDVCSVFNLDHQIVLGKTETGFELAQPWSEDPGTIPTTPRFLTSGTWAECDADAPINFYRLGRGSALQSEDCRRQALEYAVDLWNEPEKHEVGTGYGVGPHAYDRWLQGLEHGFAEEHGNWRNGVVWSESRKYNAQYLANWSQEANGESHELVELALIYEEIAKLLEEVASPAVSERGKKDRVRTAKVQEQESIEIIQRLLGSSGSTFAAA